jgi:hypothetical protein
VANSFLKGERSVGAALADDLVAERVNANDRTSRRGMIGRRAELLWGIRLLKPFFKAAGLLVWLLTAPLVVAAQAQTTKDVAR